MVGPSPWERYAGHGAGRSSPDPCRLGFLRASCATRENQRGFAPTPAPSRRRRRLCVPGPPKFVTVRRSTLTVIALVSLLSFALLASDLAHGHGLYRFERPLLRSLGSPSSVDVWADVADLLAAPAIIAVFAVAFAFGALRRSLVRVTVYTGFAAVTFLIERAPCQAPRPRDVQRPAHLPVRERHGSVRDGTRHVVGAPPAAREMGTRRDLPARRGLGPADVLAVVGAHWHTPFDAIGSVSAVTRHRHRGRRRL